MRVISQKRILSRRGRISHNRLLAVKEEAKTILGKSGTVQEYRKQFGIVGRKKRDGSRVMKGMEYWGFVAIVDGFDDKKIRLRVIVRMVGDGEYHFWSVMPHSRLKNKDTYKLASESITDE